MQRSEHDVSAAITTRTVIAILASVLVAWALSIYLVPKWYTPPTNSGEFGDMFGAVNALFSGLAFAGVVIAILLQRQELQLQRTELVQTRDELKGQKQQLEAQNETFRRQAFENTFFQLLSLHHQIVNSIDIQVARGRDSFGHFYKVFCDHYNERKRKKPNEHDEASIRYAYDCLYKEFQSDIGHCFRNLYNIVKFVKGSDISNQRFYTNLIRAQLSSYELLVLFYNCVTSLGNDKFKPLAEEFGFFKNLPFDQLVSLEHRSLYVAGAYRGSSAPEAPWVHQPNGGN